MKFVNCSASRHTCDLVYALELLSCVIAVRLHRPDVGATGRTFGEVTRCIANSEHIGRSVDQSWKSANRSITIATHFNLHLGPTTGLTEVNDDMYRRSDCFYSCIRVVLEYRIY